MADKKQDETPEAQVKAAEKARAANVNTTTPTEAGAEVGRRMGGQDTSNQS